MPQQTSGPTICALIAAYNSAATLPATLASLAAQTVPPDEIVLIDDGSSDTTVALARAFAAAHPQLNMWVHTQANAGPGPARNAGMALSRSDYVAFLDADDSWQPAKILRLKEALAQTPVTLLTHDVATAVPGATPQVRSSASMPGRRVLGRQEQALTLLVWHWLTTSAVTVNRVAALAAGGFHGQLRLGEDWDLWLRLLSQPRATLGYLPAVLTVYTVNPVGLSSVGVQAKNLAGLAQLEALVTQHSGRLARQFGVNRLALWGLAWASLQKARLGAPGDARQRGWLIVRQLWRVPQALRALYGGQNAL